MSFFVSARAQRRASHTFTTLGALAFGGMVVTAAGALMHPVPARAVPTVEANEAINARYNAGGVSGSFGYPTTDTTVIDGLETTKFVGPGGTEIQWSDLAGFSSGTSSSEGTPSMTTPKPSASPPAASSAPAAEPKTSKWRRIPLGIAALAGLAGLLRLLTRGRMVEEPAELVRASRRVEPVREKVGASQESAADTSSQL